MVEFNKEKQEQLILLLVGIPACGKSTLSKRFADDLVQNEVVSLDEIQNELSQGSQNIEAWHQSKIVALDRCKQSV